MQRNFDRGSHGPSNHDLAFDRARGADFASVGNRAVRRMILVPQSHALRAQTEACIAAVYEQCFSARNLGFPSTLIALLDGDDRPLCAAGLRTAGDGFFSEIYLDIAIEQALSTLFRKQVAREAIFEVTTLASRNVEVSRVFLRQLAVCGKRAGFEWSFFTATTRLRKLLRYLGIPTLELGPADPRRLRDPERWGTYYTHSPQVCAVDGRWLDGRYALQEGNSPDA